MVLKVIAVAISIWMALFRFVCQKHAPIKGGNVAIATKINWLLAKYIKPSHNPTSTPDVNPPFSKRCENRQAPANKSV